MKYLTQVTETYRIDTEEQVISTIEEAKNDTRFTLVKHTSQYKERKAKGEVVDAWYKVTLTKQFTDEKEPDATVTINYGE